MEASAAVPIRVVAPGPEEADRLVAALGDFPSQVESVDGNHEVQIVLDGSTGELLVKLFNSIGEWVTAGNAASCQVHFGKRAYTLLAVADGHVNDATQFLVERTIQLQTALETRIVIEQAKGVLAERFELGMDEAFELLRSAARSTGTKIHDLAWQVVSSRSTPVVVTETLARRRHEG
jgi:ANTAR domain